MLPKMAGVILEHILVKMKLKRWVTHLANLTLQQVALHWLHIVACDVPAWLKWELARQQMNQSSNWLTSGLRAQKASRSL